MGGPPCVPQYLVGTFIDVVSYARFNSMPAVGSVHDRETSTTAVFDETQHTYIPGVLWHRLSPHNTRQGKMRCCCRPAAVAVHASGTFVPAPGLLWAACTRERRAAAGRATAYRRRDTRQHGILPIAEHPTHSRQYSFVQLRFFTREETPDRLNPCGVMLHARLFISFRSDRFARLKQFMGEAEPAHPKYFPVC